MRVEAAWRIRRQFGTDHLPFTFTAAGLTRSFTTLSQAGDESVDARVFGGMHFRTGCELGLRQGEKVGRFVTLHSLKSLKPKRAQLVPFVTAGY